MTLSFAGVTNETKSSRICRCQTTIFGGKTQTFHPKCKPPDIEKNKVPIVIQMKKKKKKDLLRTFINYDFFLFFPVKGL